MRYTLFFISLGCAPEWVDVQDAATDTKENSEQLEENNSEESNSSENIDNENTEDIENEDSENNPSDNENSEDETDSDNTEEDNNSDNNSPDNSDEEPQNDTVDYTGSYIGSFIGGYDVYGYIDEFCSGTIELDLSSNYNLTGETLCETYQTTWTYTFDAEIFESGSDINVSGTMTASDPYGSSFSTELNGFVVIENNGSSMSLEWEFPDYSIIGNADLELQ